MEPNRPARQGGVGKVQGGEGQGNGQGVRQGELAWWQVAGGMVEGGERVG